MTKKPVYTCDFHNNQMKKHWFPSIATSYLDPNYPRWQPNNYHRGQSACRADRFYSSCDLENVQVWLYYILSARGTRHTNFGSQKWISNEWYIDFRWIPKVLPVFEKALKTYILCIPFDSEFSRKVEYGIEIPEVLPTWKISNTV